MKKTICFLFSLFVFLPIVVFAAEELKVISATPQGDLNSLDDSKAVTITFNRPVVALSGVKKDVREGPITLIPEVSGTYRWMGTSTLSFIPDKKLTYSTRYVVQVNAPITSVDGAIMAKDFSFSFVTPRPQIQEVFPYQGQTQITLEQPIFMKFNQAMDIKKAAQFVTLTSEGGTEVPVMVSYPDEEDVKRSRPYWVDEITDTILKIIPSRVFAEE